MFLKAAYLANIVILAPVLMTLYGSNGTAGIFGPGFGDSPGLRLLVFSLWFAIMTCSALGLFWPERFVGILVLQVIYKGLWLVIFILPLIIAGKPWPVGVALTFLPIVLIWPLIIVSNW